MSAVKRPQHTMSAVKRSQLSNLVPVNRYGYFRAKNVPKHTMPAMKRPQTYDVCAQCLQTYDVCRKTSQNILCLL